MRPIPILLLSLAWLPLRGQTEMLRTHLDRQAPVAPAHLVLLEAPGSKALQGGFRTLLQAQALRGFQVPLEGFDLGTALGREQAAAHRCAPKAQWLLVGAGGQVKAKGIDVPDAESFARALQDAGFQDRARALEAYLKQAPESLSAREALIAELRARGERTAQRLLGITVETPRERLGRGDLAAWRKALGDPATADLTAARTLEPAEDLDAWGPFAQALDEAFRLGVWQEMTFTWTQEGRPLDGASPTLRGLYTRWLPTVEAALPRQPESESLWPLWRWMQAATGGSRLRLLMARLVPCPTSPPDQWPPEPALHALRATARTPDDWRVIHEAYRARWDALPVPEAIPDQPTALEPLWEQTLGPLLESALGARDLGIAEADFQEALLKTRWASLPAKAAALAQACGHPSLAARWGLVRP
ncbi:MAG TPA: hypothetical protein VJ623_13315 [Holophagaceae bacterium]|nr:hypothetical protein [Holophagaceae bacterium]